MLMKTRLLSIALAVLSLCMLQGCDDFFHPDKEVDIYDQSIDGELYKTVELHIGDSYSLTEGYAPRYFIFAKDLYQDTRIQIWSKMATKYGNFYYDGRATSSNGYVDSGSIKSTGKELTFGGLTRAFNSALQYKTFKIIKEGALIRLQAVDNEDKYLKLSYVGSHTQGPDMLWDGKEAKIKTAD